MLFNILRVMLPHRLENNISFKDTSIRTNIASTKQTVSKSNPRKVSAYECVVEDTVYEK